MDVGTSREPRVTVDAGGKKDDTTGASDQVNGGLNGGSIIVRGALLYYDPSRDADWFRRWMPGCDQRDDRSKDQYQKQTMSEPLTGNSKMVRSRFHGFPFEWLTMPLHVAAD
ncbi:MAG: hypothetical protein ACJZ8O_01850 [Pirellulaceae bacterium]